MTDEGLKMSDELSGWLLTDDEEMDRLKNDEAVMGVEATVKRFLRSLKVTAPFSKRIRNPSRSWQGISLTIGGHDRSSATMPTVCPMSKSKTSTSRG